MKQRDLKNQNKLLHQLLDGAVSKTGASPLTGCDQQALSRYQEALKHLENQRINAPEGFAARVMAALPDNPRRTWTDRLKSLWPERRFWPIPALAGALATLFLVAALTLFRTPSNTLLIPVVLDFYAPSAKQVELVGTFSNWTPGIFSLKGPDAVGYWAIAVDLPPGRYEYAFLINGSKLVPDDDGEALRPDGFGGNNSVLLLRAAINKSTRTAAAAPFEQAGILPFPPEKTRSEWQPVIELGISGGLSRDQLEPLLASMAVAGIDPNQARANLVPLLKNGVIDTPAEELFLKVREGILKQARPDNLKSIFAKRESAFEQAKTLLAKTGYDSSIQTDKSLLFATAFALESGFDPSSLGEVLIAGKGRPSQQIAAVIELGEVLECAGIKPDRLLPIMKECLSKNMDVEQIKRVTERVKERLQKDLNHQVSRFIDLPVLVRQHPLIILCHGT